MARLFALLASVLFLVTPLNTHAANLLPNPTGYVNDYAGVLTTTEKQDLEKNLAAYKNASTNEIVVVLVKELQGLEVQEYAVRLFEQWRIGDQEKDNGLLLLVAVDERKLWIEIGYGLEGEITDGQSGTIYRNTLTPSFREGDYYGGIRSALAQIQQEISGEITLPDSSNAENENKNWGTIGFAGMVILFQLLAGVGRWLARSKSIWHGGIIGGIGGIIVGFIIPSLLGGLAMALVLGGIGIFLDWVLSRSYKPGKHSNHWFYSGGGWGGGSSSSGGGFGGFGGGSSGGGGAGGSW